MGTRIGSHGAHSSELTDSSVNPAAFLQKLSSPFPEAQISWRAQSVTKDGDKAMALAYIDARDVMGRLDEVIGAGNWSDEYIETVKGRILCTLSIRVCGEWVSKSDGAGDSDVEAEKGAISDAFKRTAVKWGIGRYLYDMPTPWVPCTSYEKNGKKVWSAWKQNPWDFVKKAPVLEKPVERKPMTPLERFAVASANISKSANEVALRRIVDSENYKKLLEDIDGLEEKAIIMNAVTERFMAFIPQVKPQELQY